MSRRPHKHHVYKTSPTQKRVTRRRRNRRKFFALIILPAVLLSAVYAGWRGSRGDRITVRDIRRATNNLSNNPVRNISTHSSRELTDLPPEVFRSQPSAPAGYNAYRGGSPPGALPPGVTLPGITDGGRSTAQGYGLYDGVRQRFTGKERDNETGLDYFGARYYSSVQGRFTSPDEFRGGPQEVHGLGKGDPVKQALPYADITNPQSLNKYSYAYNNPLRYIDPDGHCGTPTGLRPGQVGICVASFIKSKLVWGGPNGLLPTPGRGDGRDTNGQGGTSRLEVRVIVDAKGNVTKADDTVARSGFVFTEAGFKGTGGSEVSSPNKDEKGNTYFQIHQLGTSSTPAGWIGSVENYLNMVVTPDQKVGITPSSSAKNYPSLEVYKYTMDDKGKVTTTLIKYQPESGNVSDLVRKEKPIKADPQ